jgi:hypothetical protein
MASCVGLASVGLGMFGAGVALAGGVASRTPSVGQGCRTYGAVGISTASVRVPGHKKAHNWVVTVMADDVPGEPYPQVPSVTGSGALSGHLSNMMNPAHYNNNGPTGGEIGAWTSGSGVVPPTPATRLTASAVDPGGVVRIAVWDCPLGTSGTQ